MKRCAVLVPGLLVCALAGTRIASAQRATLGGVVLRDTTGVPLAGVEVSIPALHRTASTDERGAYRLPDLMAGRYLVVARRLGFTPAQDSVDLAEGDSAHWDVHLSAAPQLLDSVRVQSQNRKNISPALNDFEQRRASGMGRFIDEADLRKHDNDRLADVLRVLPGAMLTHGPGGSLYFVSTRKVCDGPVFQSSSACQRATPDCYATIYLDGVLYYNPPAVEFVGDGNGHVRRAPSDEAPPDINKIVAVSDLAGVEYYASNMMLPPKFSGGTNACGTVLLWTRER